jgi:hypothetical protein
MKRVVMAGVWIMIAAVISTFLTAPLGYGTASGVAFAGGMLLAWLGGLLLVGRGITSRLRSTRNGS